MQHIVEGLVEAIREARGRGQPLCIRGGGTKDFYGGPMEGAVLDTGAYSGIVAYEPTELVITARAGTLLAEVEAALHAHGQMLAFEPPHFGPGATLGGCIAAGLSGPRRPYAGAVRDLVLGVRMLDGKATDLRFGGQVMKNVAGYDLSRLVVGSLGTLGVLLEISLKVLPKPPAEITLRLEHGIGEAITLMNAWARKPLPVTATCHTGDHLYVRLTGAEPAVRAARAKIGGEEIDDGSALWERIREQTLGFFDHTRPLWRISVKPTTPPLSLRGTQLVEWSGALRWLLGDAEPRLVREAAARAGGHATQFRGGDRGSGVFHPLAPAMYKIHQRLKAAFDPDRIFNPGRLYPDL